MPISEQKTHVSLDTFEFAKRWVHRGKEITGYSIGGLLETWKRYSLLHEFFENQQQHGWTLSLKGRPGLISDIYNVLGRSSERPIKLYKCFYYIKNIINMLKSEMQSNTQNRTLPYIDNSSLWHPKLEMLCSSLLSYIHSEFGVPLLSPGYFMPSTSTEVVAELIQEVKVSIVEQDMNRVFGNVELISSKLDKPFLDRYPGLGNQPYRALRRECYPAIMCLNDNLRRQVDYINRLSSNDPSINIFELGISKYFVADEILSLRAAHSISLAESQLTKWLLYLVRLRYNKIYPLLTYSGFIIDYPLDRMVNKWHPDKLKAKEKYFRVRKAKARIKDKLDRTSNKVIHSKVSRS